MLCLFCGAGRAGIFLSVVERRPTARRNVCGDERIARRARLDGCGQDDEKARSFLGACVGSFGGLRGVRARRCLPRGGGGDLCRAPVFVCNAAKPRLFHRIRACHSDLARLGALSAAFDLRKDPRQDKKERRKSGLAACGVCPVEIGLAGHCEVFLSRDGRGRADLFSCLCFLRVFFQAERPKSTCPRRARKG